MKTGVEGEEADCLIARLETDFRAEDSKVQISEADLAMLNYADKLTVSPQEIEATDIEILRTHGFDDAGIHDICCVVAYFAFVNRVADGLGVELEERF